MLYGISILKSVQECFIVKFITGSVTFVAGCCCHQADRLLMSINCKENHGLYVVN